MKKIKSSFSEIAKRIYLALVKSNDTAQKKALGFGLGVFLGILPGSGPIASLILASFFRLNRASALLGSLLTNTWLSIVTFILAVKTGSYLMGIDWHQSLQGWKAGKIIIPVLLGYFVVAFFLGLIGYLIALIIIQISLKNKKQGI